jgi:hypothetical protein
MDFFMKTLLQAADDIDKGIDPNKVAANSAEANEMSSNVSSFLGWAMSTITLAASSSMTPTTTPHKPLPGLAGKGAARMSNGASTASDAKRNLAAKEGWGSTNELGAPEAPGGLSSAVDTSSLDRLAGAPLVCVWQPHRSVRVLQPVGQVLALLETRHDFYAHVGVRNSGCQFAICWL